MKKSIKKHIQIGSFIVIKTGEMFRVTKLLDRKFKCELILVDAEFIYQNIEQEFYYNIEMTVFNEVASNII